MLALFHEFFSPYASRKMTTVKHRGNIVFLAGLLIALGAGWVGFPYAIYQTPAAAGELQS